MRFVQDFREAATAEDVCKAVASHYHDATYKYTGIFLRYCGEGHSIEDAFLAALARLDLDGKGKRSRRTKASPPPRIDLM